MRVRLSAAKSGPLEAEDAEPVDRFRHAFDSATASLSFDYIDAGRFFRSPQVEDIVSPEYIYALEGPVVFERSRAINPKAREPERRRTLSERIQMFIGQAQVNYRAFFSSREPDLFPRIFQNLTQPDRPRAEPEQLLNRLTRIREIDKRTDRYGLEPDRWDYESLVTYLSSSEEKPGLEYALSALSAYVDVLESRAAERELVADRLQTFETLMNEFLQGKQIAVDPRNGLRIQTDSGALITEDKLSSGEYHLLYLMVSALLTRVRGTVIAIDEPELSMHISWQRKLVRALIECASGAEPQFILATHSPDIATPYRDRMILFGAFPEED